MAITSIFARPVFLSTLSLRRATDREFMTIESSKISIHALLAESDIACICCIQSMPISIHALLAESDPQARSKRHPKPYFYPRSPCGERLAYRAAHSRRPLFLSTLSLRRATNIGVTTSQQMIISIHALLAESDANAVSTLQNNITFLSTLSLRRATRMQLFLSALPGFLSTLSLRRATYPQFPICAVLARFLSTLSLRRATSGLAKVLAVVVISIHALLAESDARAWTCTKSASRFLSTLSLRRATILDYFSAVMRQFLSTLSLRRATEIPYQREIDQKNFYPRSPCGERHVS